MKNYLYLTTAVIGVSMVTINTTSWAQCLASQDCAALGYTEASCSNGGVKCPFGNKWACFNKNADVCRQEGFTQTCTGTGQVSSGEACANLYKKCDCKPEYKYACTGHGYTGGSGAACSGKYTACKCATNFTWTDGICMPPDGPDGNYYYCSGKVVGIKTNSMDFYIATKVFGGGLSFDSAKSKCTSYKFCGTVKGAFPTKAQFETIYANKVALNNMLVESGAEKLKDVWYWTSTMYAPNADSGYSYDTFNLSSGYWDYDRQYGSNYGTHYNEYRSYYALPVLKAN